MHGLSPGVKCVAPLFRHVLSQIMKCTHPPAPVAPHQPKDGHILKKGRSTNKQVLR